MDFESRMGLNLCALLKLHSVNTEKDVRCPKFPQKQMQETIEAFHRRFLILPAAGTSVESGVPASVRGACVRHDTPPRFGPSTSPICESRHLNSSFVSFFSSNTCFSKKKMSR